MPSYSGMWNLVQQLQATAAGNWPAPPGAPTSVSATAGNAQATVSFTAPTYTGNPAGITGYRVTSSPGAITATGASSPITVTGLTNGVSYTFTAAAQGASGYGAESDPSNAVTPAIFAVEDVFSTYLYTGNGTSQTITNGINLSGQGGMVWTKRRVNTGGIGNTYHILTDTVRGANKQLYSNTTDAQATNANMITSFNANGYSIGSDGNVNFSNVSPQTYVSWTFREAPKFFDVVTYTGNGVRGRKIAHNLGSTPGVMIIKSLAGRQWVVYHRSLGADYYLQLQATNGQIVTTAFGGMFDRTDPTSTEFTLGEYIEVNNNGEQYVAYLFAHDTASDGIIQCGSFTTDGSGQATVNLGWEPQWTLIKASSTTSQWQTRDVMRGMSMTGSNILYPNLDSPEDATTSEVQPTATGFFVTGNGHPANQTFIYIAIRRGPMKTPTLGTSVYESVAYSGNNTSNRIIGSTTLMDMILVSARNANTPAWSTTYAHYAFDRLRGDTVSLATSKAAAEIGGWASYIDFDLNVGWDTGSTTDQSYLNGTGSNYLSRSFKRAPGFFDEVCWTGNGVAVTLNHNLGVAPELIIVKPRNSTGDWLVAAGFTATNYISASLTADAPNKNASYNSVVFMAAPPTATQFQLGWIPSQSGVTSVAYLFASAPGVSKVGSYTGNGSSQTINCGFSSTARFILIKRTDTVGDWYTWDAATGLVAGNDPHLSLNNANAEVTTDDSVDTDSTGFIVNQDAATNINVNGASYIFLAVA